MRVQLYVATRTESRRFADLPDDFKEGADFWVHDSKGGVYTKYIFRKDVSGGLVPIQAVFIKPEGSIFDLILVDSEYISTDKGVTVA